jgi:hypothetical protein
MTDLFNIDLQMFAEENPIDTGDSASAQVETSTVEAADTNAMSRDEFKASSSFLKSFQASQEAGMDQKPVEETTVEERTVTDNSSQPDNKAPGTKEGAAKKNPTRSLQIADAN